MGQGLHYFKNGHVHRGATHKMPDGTIYTGAKHRPNSKQVVHFRDLSDRAKTAAKRRN